MPEPDFVACHKCKHVKMKYHAIRHNKLSEDKKRGFVIAKVLSENRKAGNAGKLFRMAKKVGTPESITHDGYAGYPKKIAKYFPDTDDFQSKGFWHKHDNNSIESTNMEFNQRYKTMCGFGSFESTDDMMVQAYLRQTVENLFGFSKDDLGILPLRVHFEETLRGFLIVQFLTLIAFIQLKEKLKSDYTVEEALLTMRNLKCKVYDNEILVNELTKQQKDIAQRLNVLVPKKTGI